MTKEDPPRCSEQSYPPAGGETGRARQPKRTRPAWQEAPGQGWYSDTDFHYNLSDTQLYYIIRYFQLFTQILRYTDVTIFGGFFKTSCVSLNFIHDPFNGISHDITIRRKLAVTQRQAVGSLAREMAQELLRGMEGAWSSEKKDQVVGMPQEFHAEYMCT